MLRKAMSSIMRCRNGEVCLVIGVLPLKRSAHAAPRTLTARLRHRGRRRWPGPCRRGYLVRHMRNGSVEPSPAHGAWEGDLMTEIKTELLFTIALEVDVLNIGDTPYGSRRVGRFGSGSFKGSKLKGS